MKRLFTEIPISARVRRLSTFLASGPCSPGCGCSSFPITANCLAGPRSNAPRLRHLCRWGTSLPVSQLMTSLSVEILLPSLSIQLWGAGEANLRVSYPINHRRKDFWSQKLTFVPNQKRRLTTVTCHRSAMQINQGHNRKLQSFSSCALFTAAQSTSWSQFNKVVQKRGRERAGASRLTANYTTQVFQITLISAPLLTRMVLKIPG